MHNYCITVTYFVRLRNKEQYLQHWKLCKLMLRSFSVLIQWFKIVNKYLCCLDIPILLFKTFRFVCKVPSAENVMGWYCTWTLLLHSFRFTCEFCNCDGLQKGRIFFLVIDKGGQFVVSVDVLHMNYLFSFSI